MEYDVQVRAVNSVGPGSWSATVTGATEAAPAPPPADSCVTPLGTLTDAITQTGSWAGECASSNRSGSYARFYSFTLGEATEVTIGLSSDQDTYLFLLQGAGREGTEVAHNDDVESVNTNSQIVQTLDPGEYTVEATTFSAGITGNFTLTISEPTGGVPLPQPADSCQTPLAANASGSVVGLSGAWTDDCPSTSRDGAYARYYSFSLSATSEVTITTDSQVDTVLHLLEGAGRTGTSLFDNDDIETGNTNSQIEQSLNPGAYTIEVTTYTAGDTGDFTLTVTGLEAGTGEPPVADVCVTDLGTVGADPATVTGAWADDCDSANWEGRYARYYYFTLGDAAQVTIYLESDTDPYLYLLQGTGRMGTALHENDDIETGVNNNSRISEALQSGNYTIEATTYTAGVTGEFTLSVSWVGGQ